MPPVSGVPQPSGASGARDANLERGGSGGRSAPGQLDGTLRVRGANAPIEILRDSSGVPHVRAATTHDAFFGQGFVHAQDRLWQMCFDRRRADGRLAEWLGPRAQVMDVFVRRVGIAASAQLDHAHFDDETRGVPKASATGVNALIQTGHIPYDACTP